MLYFLGTLTIPASPGHDQIRVDLANEILSSRLPAVKASYRLLVTRLLLLFQFRPGHANVLGQEVNEHLQKRGRRGGGVVRGICFWRMTA